MTALAQLWLWLRRTFSWSTSRESWLERVGFLILLAAVLVVWHFSDRMTLLQQVLAWGSVTVAAAVLLRRGWLVLFGPVLFYEMIRSARRGRYFLLRCFYAGLLLFILFCVWLPYAFDGFNRPGQAAIMALNFFEVFMLVQLIAVTLLTPAYVGGAISEEKDRKTLEFLLATDLRNREIVLSKLGARLANLGLFVLTGLPILGFLQLIGGVDPTLVLVGFAATGLTVLGLAAISILNSVYYKRPRDSIAITYLMLVTYIALASLLYLLKRFGPIFSYIDFSLDLTWLVQGLNWLRSWFGGLAWTKMDFSFGDFVDVLNAGNLAVMIGKIGDEGSLAAPALVRDYAWYQGIFSAVCIGWAIIRLRRIALKQAYGRVLKAGSRHKWRQPVGVLPMLWKEVAVEGGLRLNWIAAIILAILFLLSLVPFGMIFGFMIYEYVQRGGWDIWDQRGFSQGINACVRVIGAMVASLLLLAVAVRASTSIGNERDKQTLDSLLTSPLDSNAILWGKFMGSILSVRVGWVWLGFIWAIGVVTGALHVFALPLLLASWFVCAAFVTMFGLWFSMTCRTTMRATVYTVLGTIFVWAGHWLIWMCCIPFAVLGIGRHTERALEYVAKFEAGLTMPMFFFSFSYMEMNFAVNWDRELIELIPFSLMGLFIWVVVCAIFWFGILSPRFRAWTMRQDERFPEVDYYPGHDQPESGSRNSGD